MVNKHDMFDRKMSEEISVTCYILLFYIVLLSKYIFIFI